MRSNENERRTFILDESVVKGLTSDDINQRLAAVASLPDALSREEVSDVGLQVGHLPGWESIREGERLEKKTLRFLGSAALIVREDLVTAESVAKELRAKHDFAGYLIATLAIRKAKKRIVKDILGE